MKEGAFFILNCNRAKPTFLGRIIKRSTKGRVTHSALAIVRNGRIVIFDSQKDGSNFKRYELWMEKFNYKFTAHMIPCVDPEKVFDAMLDYANYPYGKLDLVRHWLYNWSGIWLGIDKEHKKLICSESTLVVIRDLGILKSFHLPNNKPIHKANPDDVLTFCEARLFPTVQFPAA